MAGYSGTPLERKLGVKDGQTVFLDRAPDGFELAAPTTTRLPKQAAITLTFHTMRSTLEARLSVLIDHTEQAGMIWVCWPKKAAAKARAIETDLDENVVRALGLAAGVVDVKVCAIDEVWSGPEVRTPARRPDLTRPQLTIRRATTDDSMGHDWRLDGAGGPTQRDRRGCLLVP